MEHLIAIVVSAMAFAVMAATPCPVVVIPDMPTEVEKFAAAELAGELGMVWLGTWPDDNSLESISKADKFLEDSLDSMEASGWKGISQIQIHIRTDLSRQDPFCPSSDCIRKAIRRLHDRGITVQSFTWTEGANKDVLRKIWKLGFDNIATDDPLVLFELLPELGAMDVSEDAI